jgi:transposase
MAREFIFGNRNQQFTLPPVVDRWIPQGHLVRLIWDCIGRMDLWNFQAAYSHEGGPAYDPAMMLAILIYGYCEGIFSSRKIAKACEEQLPFRWLTGNVVPGHCAVARFRKRQEMLIREVFIQVLRLSDEAGLVKVGRLFVDGTKINANASLESNRRLEQIEKEIDQILKEAKNNDQQEDRRFGPSRRGDELPEGLDTPRGRMERLQAAQERLEKEAQRERQEQEDKIRAREAEEEASGQKKPRRKPKAPEEAVDQQRRANVTDPDSRIMKTRHRYVQGYNAQVVVTEERIIVAMEITREENDCQQLEPMLEETRQSLEQAGVAETMGSLAADAGYWAHAMDVERIEHHGPVLYVATKKDWKMRQELAQQGPPRGRIPVDATPRERMDRRLLTKKGRETYRLRGQTVEAVFGHIQKNLAFTGFLRRGLQAVRSEWALICTCCNLKKLFKAKQRAAVSGRRWIPGLGCDLVTQVG